MSTIFCKIFGDSSLEGIFRREVLFATVAESGLDAQGIGVTNGSASVRWRGLVEEMQSLAPDGDIVGHKVFVDSFVYEKPEKS